MRKLLLVLAPLALLAHVQVDTVIRLDSYLFEGCFIPELNKLYIQSRYRILVVDCSTYQLKAEIPIRPRDGVPDFAWNRQRQKLYFRTNAAPRVDSLLVIDAVGDTLIRWIPARYGGGPLAYVSSSDRLYFGIEGLDSSMLVLDCATDSVVNRIPVPISGMGFSSKSWDSVGNKLYAGIGVFGRPPMIAVYDCGTDSLLN
ncbi:hypothetical protein FJY69_06220, partial [candidate division WOR-3 bacterium]|nr:hypothetical protein [candidate division WOR-3 bacterium]